MSSSTGTKNTARKRLSAQDICAIIKQCALSKVETFSYAGIDIKFHSRRNESADQPSQAADHNTTVVSEFPEASRDQAQLMDAEALAEAEEAQLLIDDPLAYEQTQIDRHIQRNRVNESSRH